MSGNTESQNDDRAPFHIVSESEAQKRSKLEFIYDILIAPFNILIEDKKGKIGISICLFYLLMGTVGVSLTEAPSSFDYPPRRPPFETMATLFGTDSLGQDILNLTIHSTPAMLKMMASGAIFATSIALLVGTFSGYKGGRIDRFLVLISDIMIAIPGLPLVIVVAAIVQPRDPYIVGIILTINAWAGLARSIRSEVLSIRESDYIEASRAIGLPSWNIILKGVLPDIMPYVLINFAYMARRVIISSVGLYFIGVLPFTTLNWGVMMNMAYNNGAFLHLHLFHWFLVPMTTIVVLIFGLIMLGQSADRIFNPRLRAKHQKSIKGDESH